MRAAKREPGRCELAMQPLSRVNPNCATEWGSNSVMLKRPHVAAKVAQYIAEWSEIESLLGLFLALLLHANQKAILAIYSGLENRTSQLRMIASAAEASLTPDHFDLIETLLRVDIRPCMKYRDRLAHWNWGYADQLTDALLLRDPADKLANMTDYVNLQQLGPPKSRDLPIRFDRIYVLKETDLDGALKRIQETQEHLQTALGTIWDVNSQKVRDALVDELKAAPAIRAALDRLEVNRKNPKSPAQPPELNLGEDE
jgi:hypothetical protein